MITVGIDEVGRGSLAGPLVAGAVILDKKITGLKDSKLLSKIQREKLDKIIRTEALALGLGWASASEIDALGLTASVALAMRRALAEIKCGYDEIIIDGNYNFLQGGTSENKKCVINTLVKADSLVPAVSAASVVAKVARDNYMIDLAKKYEGYGFEKHVGYCTKLHLKALKALGPSEVHRFSYEPVKLLMSQCHTELSSASKVRR
jgi:ribonuclease HII